MIFEMGRNSKSRIIIWGHKKKSTKPTKGNAAIRPNKKLIGHVFGAKYVWIPVQEIASERQLLGNIVFVWHPYSNSTRILVDHQCTFKITYAYGDWFVMIMTQLNQWKIIPYQLLTSCGDGWKPFKTYDFHICVHIWCTYYSHVFHNWGTYYSHVFTIYLCPGQRHRGRRECTGGANSLWNWQGQKGYNLAIW